MRCLWIGRDIPYPSNTGEKVYSLELATALAEAGASVKYLGVCESSSLHVTMQPMNVEWVPVRGNRSPYWRCLFSTLPLVAASLNIAPMRKALDALLSEQWDAIILDNYAAVWAFTKALEYARLPGRNPPILVHISHNAEAKLAKSILEAYSGGPIKRIILWINASRIARAERRLVSQSQITTAITEDDAAQFAKDYGPRLAPRILTPGYSGPVMPPRRITQHSERRVVLIGSFKWVVKQENLKRLLNIADARLYENGITLDIIGEVPPSLLKEVSGGLRATEFHGFVSDLSNVTSRARIAIVPELVGGGFKLKILDYIFCRLPVATISEASAGIPQTVGRYFLKASTLEDLVSMVISNIDKTDELQRLQTSAFDAAATEFDWKARGRDLLSVIQRAEL